MNRLRTAADGDAIVELAHAQRPHVILMDIRMPGTDGFTATERILAGLQMQSRLQMVVHAYEHRLLR